MALNSATYYSNSIQGQPLAGADIDVTRVDSVPKYSVGMLIERADGNRYRYCHIGAALNAGRLVGQTTTSGGATYGAAVVVAPASAQIVSAEPSIQAGSVGSHYVEVTIAGISANKYQGGYLVTTRGTGLGETYRIVGNTATGNPTTGNLRIQLYEAVKVALTATTGLIIVPTIYTDLQAAQTSSSTVTGVLMSTTAAEGWAWVCTRGIVGAQEDGVITVTQGSQVSVSRGNAGCYAMLAAAAGTVNGGSFISPIVGYSITPGGGASTSRQGVIFCQCE